MAFPHLEILPAEQRRLWQGLGQVPHDFALYGGTALALRLGHRRSDDFDFFSASDFSPAELEGRVPLLRGATRIQSAPNTLTCIVQEPGPVRLSFFGGLGLRRLEDPDWVDPPGVWLASLVDLAATKVKTVQDRAEAKDYRDIEALLAAGLALREALAAAAGAWGAGFNPLLSLKALSYFGDGDLPDLPEETRRRLLAAVRETEVSDLPDPRPLPGGLTPDGPAGEGRPGG
jgi:hypothetical protein